MKCVPFSPYLLFYDDSWYCCILSFMTWFHGDSFIFPPKVYSGIKMGCLKTTRKQYNIDWLKIISIVGKPLVTSIRAIIRTWYKISILTICNLSYILVYNYHGLTFILSTNGIWNWIIDFIYTGISCTMHVMIFPMLRFNLPMKQSLLRWIKFKL